MIRAKNKKNLGTRVSKTAADKNRSEDGICLDKSFSRSTTEDRPPVLNRSIDDFSPAELLRLAKSQKFSADDFELIKSKFQEEADKEKRLILIKIIQQSGKNNYFKILLIFI